MINKIKRYHLCLGCGLCSSVLGENKCKMELGIDGFYSPKVVGNLTKQENKKIERICPGIRVVGSPHKGTWGPMHSICQAWAADKEIRHKAASGGVVTSLAICLLEQKKVDAILQVGVREYSYLYNELHVSRTKEEVINNAQSRYAPALVFHRIKEILNSDNSMFALIGKPCDMAAMQNFIREYPQYEGRIKYYISIFCAGMPSYNATIQTWQQSGHKDDPVSLKYRGDGWPGNFKAVFKDGSHYQLSYNESWGNILGKQLGFRCKICPDGIGMLADVAVGDSWNTKNGYPDFTEDEGRCFCMVRTERGEELIHTSIQHQYIEKRELNIDKVKEQQPYQWERRKLEGWRLIPVQFCTKGLLHFKGLSIWRQAVKANIKKGLYNTIGTYKRIRGKMGSSKKIARGVAWTTIANIVNGIYGFISVPILIGYFGKANYGLIGLAMSVNVYLRLMDLGLNSTNVRFFSNWLTKGEQGKVNKLFQTSVSSYGIIGIINALVLVAISFFSQPLFHLDAEQDVIIKHLFYILAISAFISWFTACFDQYIRANEYVGWTQKMTLIPKALQIIVLIVTVTIGLSIENYYALTAFSMFAIIPLLIYKIKRISPFIDFKFGFDKQVFKEILPYTLNIFSFGIFQFSVTHLRPVFLGMRGTLESVADFSVLNSIVSVVIMLGGAFLGVFLPSASKIVAENNKEAIERVTYDGTKYISIALCFCCFGVMSVSSELIRLYVGEDYLYLVPWLNFWLLTTLSTHNQAISSLILSGSDIRAITYTVIVSSIIGLMVCWFTIPTYQVGGTVIGYGVYLIIQLLFYYLYYWPKKMDIDSWKVFSYSFVPYVVIGLVISLIINQFVTFVLSPWMLLLIKGAAFAIPYMLLVLLLLNDSDKAFIASLVNRNRSKR